MLLAKQKTQAIAYKCIFERARVLIRRMTFGGSGDAMKPLLLAYFVLVLAIYSHGHVSPVSDSFKACLAESNMTRDDFIQALKSGNDTQAQCIASCTMEKERFMSNETIHVDAIITKMEEVSQEIGKSQITYLVKACAAEAEDHFTGKCGIAHSVVRCIHDELRKEGWI